jgi:integrase
MRGTVRKRGNTWSFIVDEGNDPVTGKRRQRWKGGFKTRRAAEDGLREALNRIGRGDDPIPEKVTYEEFLERRWLPHLAAQDKPRPRTRERYADLLRTYVVPHIGAMQVERVRPGDVQRALDAATKEGRAPRTVRQIRAAVSSSFTAAVKWHLVSVNPVRATETPTPADPKLRTPTPAELRVLINQAKGTPWETPVLLAATTGTRRGETLAVLWANVDLDGRRIKVVDALQRLQDGGLTFVPPKTARAVRTVPIPAFVVAQLRAHKAEQARRRLAAGEAWADLDLVCDRGDGGPLCPDAFTHGFQRIAQGAGLSGVRLHDLRHGVATALAKSGTPPLVTSRVLGHSDPAFTMRVYQHVDEEMVDRAAQGIESAFGT